jgi:hypothetical protein
VNLNAENKVVLSGLVKTKNIRYMSNGKKVKGTNDGSTNTDVASSITKAAIMANLRGLFSFKPLTKMPKIKGSKA